MRYQAYLSVCHVDLPEKCIFSCGLWGKFDVFLQLSSKSTFFRLEKCQVSNEKDVIFSPFFAQNIGVHTRISKHSNEYPQ